ncbi:MAG: HAMP domain-containing histidine kinase, partial [Flavobacteriaceae bacterium]|nr:HAMP domain-containing histidine kinase [Flavobacteriaceae bacterium]
LNRIFNSKSDVVSKAEFESMVQPISNSAERMTLIVEQLNSLSQATANFETKEVYISDVIERVLKTHHLSVELNKKMIELDYSKPESLHTVKVDIQKMEQVILNLIRNAIESLEKLGRMDRKISIKVREDLTGRVAFVNIEDNGEGIDAEMVDKVYDPFITTRELNRGRGLGLTVSLSIMREHGGDLTFQSWKGKGSCFSIRLPMES